MKQPSDNSALYGSLSIFFSAALWGVFWIPIRYFDEAGLTAMWTIAAINLVAFVVALPVALYKTEAKSEDMKWIVILGMGMGISIVCYFAGLLLSDVLRVTFLFYLLPIWATLLSKLLFNVPIGKIRMLSLGFAVCGIWLLLGAGGWPIPQNIGDVFGLLSGIGWAFGLTMMRGKQSLDAWSTTASSLFFAFITAVILGCIMMVAVPDIQPPFPDFSVIKELAIPLCLFSIIMYWPTEVGQLWGAKFVAATTAALLTMSEIIVATISTSYYEASNLSWISWIGGGLIIIAIFVDMLANKYSDA